jgi:hypothetical protein
MTDKSEEPRSAPAWALVLAKDVFVPLVVAGLVCVGTVLTIRADLRANAEEMKKDNRSLDIEMVRIAMGVLRYKNEEVKPTQQQIQWAIDTVNAYTDPDIIPAPMAQDLLNNPLQSNPDPIAAPSPAPVRTPPASGTPAAPAAVSTPSVASRTGGWVAVGFLRSGTTDRLEDVLFKNREDVLLTQVPAPGARIKANNDTNVRYGAADWGGPRWAASKDACFEVVMTQPMQAGSRTQIWAQVALVPCDSE